MLCQKSYSSFRLTLFSVHNIGGLCQHVPFGTLLDITHRHDGWCVLASMDVFPHGCVFASMDVFWLVLNGLAEFSFHFAFHAVSGLQIHKHQFRGDEHNHQCCRRPTNLFVEMLKFQGKAGFEHRIYRIRQSSDDQRCEMQSDN